MSNRVCKWFLLESVSTTHGREQQIRKTALYVIEKKNWKMKPTVFR